MALLLTAAACSSDDTDTAADGDSASASSAEASDGDETSAAEDDATDEDEAAEGDDTGTDTGGDEDEAASPEDLGRVVLLGEEPTLADLLALGIPVAASSATVPGEGFQGMGELDTSGIEVYDYLNTSAEDLALLAPDQLIAYQRAVDFAGEEILAGVTGELHVIPDGITTRERVLLLGEIFGREDRAAELVADLDAAQEAARAQVAEGCQVSVAAIYPGSNIATFIEPVWAVPTALDAMGCELVPGPEQSGADLNGRLFISLELVGLLEAPQLILLQTDTVEGEREAIAEVGADELWQQLPAVESGRVSEIDRLGYPGILGETRLVGELVAIIDDGAAG